MIKLPIQQIWGTTHRIWTVCLVESDLVCCYHLPNKAIFVFCNEKGLTTSVYLCIQCLISEISHPACCNSKEYGKQIREYLRNNPELGLEL